MIEMKYACQTRQMATGSWPAVEKVVAEIKKCLSHVAIGHHLKWPIFGLYLFQEL
jgi:hypothetical protein